jgi:outer membrane protein assembly factor BamB
MDLNADGIADVVIADGVEVDSLGHVNAIDGATGELLWQIERNGDIYSSAQFFHIDQDEVPDVVIGGRVSVLVCLNGSTGDILWEFDTVQPSPGGQGWLQFYEPKAVPDRNGDNIVELVVINGGDPTAAPTNSNRRPGHLLVLDGATGMVLHQAVTPDSAESYCSVVVQPGNTDAETFIYFGTGGETVKGSMWRTTLFDLVNNDIDNAIELVAGVNKGFIAPPVLADMTNDGTLDIVCAGMDGIVSVVNGQTLQGHWAFEDAGLETYAVPGIGDLNNDQNLDVFISMNHGTWPQYDYSVQLGLDGMDGSLLMDDTSGLQISSALVHDLDGDGFAEGIMSFSPGYVFGDCGIAIHRIGQPTEFRFIIPLSLNIGSSPLLQDLDNDGLLDLITVHYTDTFSFTITRWNTDHTSNPAPLWGAYHGSAFNGIYPLNEIVAVDASAIPSSHTDKHISYSDGGITVYGQMEAQLFDCTGRSVLNLSSATNSHIANGNFNPGLYILTGLVDGIPISEKLILR